MTACTMPPSREPAQDSAPRPSLRAGALAAAVLAAVLSFPQDARAVPLGPEEQEVADFLTGDRGQQRNRNRMTLDPVLTEVARAHAADMARRHYFSHTNPDGNGPNFLARAAGYELPSSWGKSRAENFIESIGAGYATPAAAWDGWMHSQSHRTHLLAQSSFYRDQTNFGVGFYSDPASPFVRYWVIITAPPLRGTATFTSRRSAKPARVALAMPVWSDADADEARANFPETAPRPSATRAPVAEKLWNSDSPASAPRPRATRIIGAS